MTAPAKILIARCLTEGCIFAVREADVGVDSVYGEAVAHAVLTSHDIQIVHESAS